MTSNNEVGSVNAYVYSCDVKDVMVILSCCCFLTFLHCYINQMCI